MELKKRFRGFLPVVVDVETGGFNPSTDALLEIAAIPIMASDGVLVPGDVLHHHIEPFPGANIEQAAIDFIGLDIDHPFRMAVDEKKALGEIFKALRQRLKAESCSRCVLVGHNAWFDLAFLNAAIARNHIKRSPFHSFTCFDTATLAGLAVGQTVLARACEAAGIPFESSEAHSAIYDAQKTAELFCHIVNRWDKQFDSISMR